MYKWLAIRNNQLEDSPWTPEEKNLLHNIMYYHEDLGNPWKRLIGSMSLKNSTGSFPSTTEPQSSARRVGASSPARDTSDRSTPYLTQKVLVLLVRQPVNRGLQRIRQEVEVDSPDNQG